MARETLIDFDRSAANWDRNPQHAARNQAIADAIVARLPLHKGMRALEFGCGTGELTVRLAPALRSVLATDASTGMIEQLVAKLQGMPQARIEPRLLDLLAGPLPAERFDLVYSAMTLHHIEDVELLFRQVVSLLAPGGRVAVADLCAEDGSFHGAAEVPHCGFAEETLRGLAAGAGLLLSSFEEIHALTKNGVSYPLFLAILRPSGA